MKRYIAQILVLLLSIGNTQVFADQVWGDAVEVLGSNHDQFIELNVLEGETWQTDLNVYIKESGKAVVFPVTGIVNYSEQIQVSKTDWIVNQYDAPDKITASKSEPVEGSFQYEVIFEAKTDLDALSKSFDKILIRVNVTKNDVPLDTTAPIIQAPADITAEATAIMTPVSLGTPVVDDPTAIVTNNSPSDFPIGTTPVVWQATDPSGNVGSDEQLITIVDTTPPVFTELPSDKTVIYEGLMTPVDLGTPQASDIFPVQLSNDAPAGGFPVGTSTVTWTAVDANGNSATAQQIINVQYRFEGFLQPVNSDGSSIFKLGSTVPVKFRLSDAFGNTVPNAVANIYTSKMTDQIFGSVVEATSTSSATTGNLFRYDATDSLYIFNLNTKVMSKGSHNVIVTLNDGSTYTVMISLR